MKNIIIVIIVLGGLGVGGLYLKRMKDKRDEEQKSGQVKTPATKKPADAKPNPPTKPATIPAAAPVPGDAGAAIAPAPAK